MDKLLKALENKDEFSALIIFNRLLIHGYTVEEIMRQIKDNGYGNKDEETNA